MDDGREYVRVRFEGEIEFGPVGGPRSLKGRCTNLSHRGLQFETGTRLEDGQILDGMIATRDGRFKPMEVTFVVIRVEGLDGGMFRVSGEMTKLDGQPLSIG
jgi:hypothetical protein